MAEAKRLYPDRQTAAMAGYISRRAVEAEIRRQGLKVQQFSFKELMERAEEYFRANRDQVMWQVMAWEWEKGFSKLRVRKARGVGFFKIRVDVD